MSKLLTDEYPEHSDLIKFFDLCDWSWQCFVLAKRYCNNSEIHDWCALDTYLWVILKEYSYLQIAKLHDKKSTFNKSNHSLAYYCDQYGISKDPLVTQFLDEFKPFYSSICLARNKTVAHCDLKHLQNDSVLGAYEKGADDLYFEKLHEVISKLYEVASIGPAPEWSSFIENDVDELFNKINKLTS